MTTELPVVFLAFANDQDQHLATLKDESRAIFQALQPLEQQNAVAIHREESAQFDELYRDLLTYHDRIVIFHYAGHADGTMLQLEGGSGGANGIAGLLGQQTSLKLVFLNGCATKDQVKLLHDAGVPAVIATAVKISDSKATKLATAFYSALAEGHSIFAAFESARSYIEGKFASENNVTITVNRHPNFDFSDEQEQQDSLEFAWTLYTRADSVSDLEQWRLPQAREGWQIQLQDNQGPIKGVDGELIQTEYRQRLRSIKVLQCQQCGIASSWKNTDAQRCPLCGSDQVQQTETNTAIADLRVSFTTLEDEALAIAAGALGIAEPQTIQLTKIHVPYWQFDVETQTTVSAQRGQIKDVHAQTLELDWEEVNEQLELNVEAYLVPAFKAAQPKSNPASVPNWHWDCANGETVQQLDLSTTLVPLEVPIDLAFTSLCSYLQQEISDEASAVIGGEQQKNIATDTRYKKVMIRSILLPHWCATVDQGNEKASMLINGQTGASKFPQQSTRSALTDEGNLSMNIKNTKSSISERSSMLVSIYSGAGIGVMIGLLMGLAAPQGEDAKSIVAIFIGAVGVGLATLLGLNDRHFSIAKGLRIGSFGLAVAISGLVGIYVRDHGLLLPSLKDRVAEIKTLFPSFEGDDEKIIRLLGAIDSGAGATATTTKEAGLEVALGAGIQTKSLHYSGVTPDASVCEKLNFVSEAKATEKILLHNFKNQDEDGKLGLKKLADDAEKDFNGDDLLKFLLISRKALCDKPRAELPAKACTEKTNMSTEHWTTAFKSGNTDAQKLLAKIQSELSSKGQGVALGTLGSALCPATKAVIPSTN